MYSFVGVGAGDEEQARDVELHAHAHHHGGGHEVPVGRHHQRRPRAGRPSAPRRQHECLDLREREVDIGLDVRWHHGQGHRENGGASRFEFFIDSLRNSTLMSAAAVKNCSSWTMFHLMERIISSAPFTRAR